MSSKSRPVLDPDVVGPNPYPLGLSYPVGTPPTRIDWHRGRSCKGVPSSSSRISLTTGEAGRRWFERQRGLSGPDVCSGPREVPVAGGGVVSTWPGRAGGSTAHGTEGCRCSAADPGRHDDSGDDGGSDATVPTKRDPARG